MYKFTDIEIQAIDKAYELSHGLPDMALLILEEYGLKLPIQKIRNLWKDSGKPVRKARSVLEEIALDCVQKGITDPESFQDELNSIFNNHYSLSSESLEKYMDAARKAYREKTISP